MVFRCVPPTRNPRNDWSCRLAAARARMVMAFIVLSLLAGAFAYMTLPKEGEPDIQIPRPVHLGPLPRHFCR